MLTRLLTGSNRLLNRILTEVARDADCHAAQLPGRIFGALPMARP